jgi:hypothetical protein
MASLGSWTVVFEDKMILKQTGQDAGTQYEIQDDAFWNQSKFSNIWAIQYGNSVASDEVEYRDETPHTSYVDANLGDFSQFISKFESAHLAKLQSDWDNDTAGNTYDDNENIIHQETETEKIARLGPRPTTYTAS